MTQPATQHHPLPETAASLYLQETDLQILVTLASLLSEKSFVDVGAEKGAFSLALLNLGFHGHLFEPYPGHQDALRQLAANHPVHLHSCAVGAHDGTASLHVACDQSGKPLDYFHSLFPHTANPWARHEASVPVTCRSLGSLVREGILPAKIGILKIDTEGWDLQVMHGMGSLECDLLMCEFVTPSLYPDWHNSFPQPLLEAARQRGFTECIAITRQGPLERIFVNPTNFSDGQWGNLIFLRRPLLETASSSLEPLLQRAELTFANAITRCLQSLEEKEAVIQELAEALRRARGQS